MSAAMICKLLLGISLVTAVGLGLKAPAPRTRAADGELRRLLLSGIGLYGVGLVAALTHHATMAALVYACGIAVCAVAVWLSRGTEPEGPPPEDGPGHGPPRDEDPPRDPGQLSPADWEAFERALRDYAARRPVGAG